MRIAVLTEYYPDAANPASGVFVHLRAAGYRDAGHDVRVYRVRPGPTGAAAYDGVPVISGAGDGVRPDLEDYDPNVIALHTPYPGTPHVELASSLRTPRVLWVHGYEAMITALHGYRRGLAIPLSLLHDVRKLWRLRGVLRAAAAVVYVSDWLRRTAERGTRYRHPRARVIPNPVDLERFRPRGAESMQAEGSRAADDPAATDGWSDGRPRGLVLRRLDRIHGVDVAVAAFAGLEATGLTLVGEGPLADELRRRIAALGAPVRLEERAVPHARVPELLLEHDYFIAPERKAPTQGVAMCEAMACGLPVIAVRSGGVPEYVRDGTDGLLVPAGDVGALRAAVLELIGDPERARTMGRNARAYMAERCAADRVIPAELAALAEAAG